ncbi:hypothetical protein [Priestia koreensis]|uniref:hypothetical protein n=1 Tax=Priestia koreensis TaxID=284581 RepID=UPI0020419BCB|nr:hypothetical protein [Priestia koreensis]MCM3006825.1 hypothetical protein [Priestia koreensis]
MNIATGIFLGIVLLVVVAELYKMTFERNMESKDERGQLFIFKVKSLSYSVLTGGIIVGVILVAILKLMDKEYFIYYVLLVFFIQSIVSSIYLAIVRRT